MCYVTFVIALVTGMASVHKVSIYQQARDKIETDISGIIQCLNQKKESLFREITVLENEFKSKQQQKQDNVRKLESLKVRMEEELRDNLLSEVQGCLTQDLQTGINKIRLESNSLTIGYTIQIDWVDKLNVVREMIKEFSIKTVPNTVSPAAKNIPPSKKAKKKTKSKQYGFSVDKTRTAESQIDWSEWNQNLGDDDLGDDYWGDYNMKNDDLEDDYWGDYNMVDENQGEDYWLDN